MGKADPNTGARTTLRIKTLRIFFQLSLQRPCSGIIV